MSEIKHIGRQMFHTLHDAIADGNIDELKELFKDLHPGDIADFYEDLNEKYRVKMADLLPQVLDAAVLKYLEAPYKNELIKHLGIEHFRDSIRLLQDDEVIELIESIHPREQIRMMKIISSTHRSAADILARYGEESVGRSMSLDFVTVPHFWTVKEALMYLKSQDDVPENCSEVFVADDSFRPLGVVALASLISAEKNRSILEILDSDIITVNADSDREKAYALFGKYRFSHMPVTDNAGTMIGVLRAEDILRIAEEEIAEDYLQLGGISHHAEKHSFIKSCFERLKWLAVSLLNSLFSPLVISLFRDSIQHSVCLAVLMPVVGSLGGSVGVQTASLMVKDFSSGRLRAQHFYRKLMREAAVGAVNGIILGAVLGVFSFLWYGNFAVSAVLAAAMFFCASWAALIGALLPIVFDIFGYDAALSSGPLVTTITDISGYALFLGLAAMFVK
jgi:magnesium transporter